MTTASAFRLAAIALSAVTLAACHPIPTHPRPEPASTLTGSASRETPLGAADPLPPEEPSPEQLAALPEARYDAVIPGLEAYTSIAVPEYSRDSYTLAGDTAVYGEDRVTPVARLSATDFLHSPTVIVAVDLQPGWAKVMTPARRSLPSQAGGNAPAQTTGWIRRDSLVGNRSLGEGSLVDGLLGDRIIVSLATRTLTIEQRSGLTQSWDIGIGTEGTPTPSGVTGYLQARYFDPSQGQSDHRIQLTSLHSATADEPYTGADGGLIAAHFAERTSGPVSHGCLRLDESAIRAVDSLPLGTSITILP